MGFPHLIFFTFTASYLLLLLVPIVDSISSDPLSSPQINVTKLLSFPDFSALNNPRIDLDVKLLGSASFNASKGTIQIPGDPDSDDLRHQAGRAIYSSPVRLLDPRSETPASFQTTFSFQFNNVTPAHSGSTGETGYGGSGLTFIIVPDEFTVGRPGPWLAMLNDACDDDYKVVAVEFDTRMNPEFGDPNDNHVGINLGSIVSTKTVDASDVGVSLNDGSVHRAWIDYDGPRRWMEIRLGGDGDFPAKPIFSGALDLSPYLKEYMFVGFSASTGNHTQIHKIMSWNFTSTSQAYLRVPNIETCESRIAIDTAAGDRPRSEPPISYLIFAAVVGLGLIVLFVFFYTSWRRKNDESSVIALPEKKGRPRPPNKPRRFSISEIFTATRFFSESEILGSDSMGVFYRGKLPNGSQLAVKRLSAEFLSSNGLDRKRVLKEIGAMSRIRHPNLVPIRGWCQDNKETIVVYEFCPNGSLDKWLFGVGALPWTRRFKSMVIKVMIDNTPEKTSGSDVSNTSSTKVLARGCCLPFSYSMMSDNNYEISAMKMKGRRQDGKGSCANVHSMSHWPRKKRRNAARMMMDKEDGGYFSPVHSGSHWPRRKERTAVSATRKVRGSHIVSLINHELNVLIVIHTGILRPNARRQKKRWPRRKERTAVSTTMKVRASLVARLLKKMECGIAKKVVLDEEKIQVYVGKLDQKI